MWPLSQNNCSRIWHDWGYVVGYWYKQHKQPGHYLHTDVIYLNINQSDKEINKCLCNKDSVSEATLHSGHHSISTICTIATADLHSSYTWVASALTSRTYLKKCSNLAIKKTNYPTEVLKKTDEWMYCSLHIQDCLRKLEYCNLPHMWFSLLSVFQGSGNTCRCFQLFRGFKWVVK